MNRDALITALEEKIPNHTFRPSEDFDGTEGAVWTSGEGEATFAGHHPHWVKCDRSDNSNKWHFVAFDALRNKEDGTYELCGEKAQGNPEKIEGHRLIKHGKENLFIGALSFETIREFLRSKDIEGIVFHHKNDGRMCKIRKSDFGIRR